MRQLIDRTIQVRGFILIGVLILIGTVLGRMMWNNLHYMETLRSNMNYSRQIQQTSLGLETVLLDALSGEKVRISRDDLRKLSDEIKHITSLGHHSDEETPKNLRWINLILTDFIKGNNQITPQILFPILSLINQVLNTEIGHDELVLQEVIIKIRNELMLASLIIIASLIAVKWFFQSRIFNPLQDLAELLSSLTEEKLEPISTYGLNPLLHPIYNSYNDMVGRLKTLEEEKRQHTLSLEKEVQDATRTLMEQQRSLARAERLAAIGELAASIAHELRNPLAGIQISCSNLKKEINNPDQAQRLGLISNEIKRLTRLLNDLLNQAKHTPEPSVNLELAYEVEEILALTRYQISNQLKLQCNIPKNLYHQFPEDGFHQAILNLLLNATHAMDKIAGVIKIDAWEDKDSLCIAVCDEGPGFSKQVLEHGIRPFASGNGQQGTGLGLAMVQRFTRESGGYVQLTNKQPQGACVTLIFPLIKRLA
ncbi:sensor histidine kinase [Candidatus Nitrosacidococcus sp. I8]|uniref:sensor histidine kinase n=1 Tax=Candidatus Nitrosacidococcus sp. I8 TaxID=2942908 RepID=UPI0022261043|nr:ATP-binding protein [Candidatus Nitrosacidococcus sp. I8]CAH9018195.1 Adaptive-response sensory-kinase SasA [Candidatus Nitrosacidococcus sp. I8]